MKLRNILNELQNWQDAKENSRSMIVIATDGNIDDEAAETAVAVSGKRDELLASIILAFQRDKKLKALFSSALLFDKFKAEMDNCNRRNKKKGNK